MRSSSSLPPAAKRSASCLASRSAPSARRRNSSTRPSASATTSSAARSFACSSRALVSASCLRLRVLLRSHTTVHKDNNNNNNNNKNNKNKNKNKKHSSSSKSVQQQQRQEATAVGSEGSAPFGGSELAGEVHGLRRQRLLALLEVEELAPVLRVPLRRLPPTRSTCETLRDCWRR
eukprot:2735920-Rhodomonas_salina.1